MNRAFCVTVFFSLVAGAQITAAAAAVIGLGAPASQFGLTNTLPSYTVAAGTNRLLVVALGDAGSLTPPVSPGGVTFNGQPMIQGNTVSDGFFASDAIWYLPLGSSASPTTGSIAASFLGTDGRFIGASAYSGVDQTTPIDVGPTQGNSTGTDMTLSLNVPSQTGDLVFDLADVFDGTGAVAPALSTPGLGQTPINDGSGALGFGFAHYSTSTKSGASLVNMSWTTDSSSSAGSEAYLHATININQAVVPEPSSFILLIVGMAGLAGAHWRRGRTRGSRGN
jgi:hypothetical protein